VRRGRGRAHRRTVGRRRTAWFSLGGITAVALSAFRNRPSARATFQAGLDIRRARGDAELRVALVRFLAAATITRRANIADEAPLSVSRPNRNDRIGQGEQRRGRQHRYRIIADSGS
jgi:hypothetical protein